jgi:hypothetical protein
VLEQTGLQQSTNDQGLFVGKDVICGCYVDGLFFSKSQKNINKVLACLQDTKRDDRLALNIESHIAGFL